MTILTEEESSLVYTWTLYQRHRYLDSRNKLKLNYDKTEVLILTSNWHISIHYISQLVVGGALIAPTLTVRNLGAMFDQSLTMDDFVKHICKAAYFHLHNSSSIRNCLLKESAFTHVHAFISSRLDYCNAVLAGITETSLYNTTIVHIWTSTATDHFLTLPHGCGTIFHFIAEARTH